MNKIYDYDKNTFRRCINKNGDYIYFVKVEGKYVETSKEVFLLLRKSYEKIKYDKKREVVKSVQYYGDMDLTTFFVFNRNKNEDFLNKVYIHDLYEKVVDKIHKLPKEYKEIAICIFLKEMTIEETSKKLCIPVSTVGRKKKKIQEIIKKSLKSEKEICCF